MKRVYHSREADEALIALAPRHKTSGARGKRIGSINWTAILPASKPAFRAAYARLHADKYWTAKPKDPRSHAERRGYTHLDKAGLLSAKGAKIATELSSNDIKAGARVNDRFVRQEGAMIDGTTQRGGFMTLGNGCYWKSNGRHRSY